MTQAAIQVNSQASPKTILAGAERTTVVIIDDFLVDTAAVIKYAVDSAEFAPDDTFVYPGVRAQPTPEYRKACIRAMAPLLGHLYAVPRDRRLGLRNFYSLVATPPEQLAVMQRLPHFDSNSRHFFAITHYLNPGEFGGTGLFRHRPTGFENITDDRLDEYRRAGDAFLREHGDPPARYIRQSDEHFELIAEIEYRPNRLVAYPGTLLHSGLIDPDRDISADPATGRLTANFFLDFV
jgi:hypothetical protein